MSRPIPILLLLLVVHVPALERNLPNHLGLDWPNDLVGLSLDADQAAALSPPLVVEGFGRPRPVQLDVDPSGARAWFVATIRRQGRKPAPATVPIRIVGGSATSALRLETTTGGGIVVHNRDYSLRLEPGSGDQHWFAGLRPAASEAWYGRAAFSAPLDDNLVLTVRRAGPVVVEIEVSAWRDEPGPTARMPRFACGKTTHTVAAGAIPEEAVAPGRGYRARIRCVAGDPWIDVVERYRFNDQRHWTLDLEHRDRPAPAFDTAMWVRWFEYDRFGGNNRLRFHPTEPRPAQRGRPFTRLSPRWTQAGGHSQDWFLTTGGAPGEGVDRNAPALGLVATFASKWVNPGAQRIVCRVESGRRGAVFPLADGGRHGPAGQRSWALCAGPRSSFDETGRLDSLVRRHNDWTLQAQVERYILAWQRDPARRGPRILVDRQRLEHLRAVLEAGLDTPTGRILAAAQERYRSIVDDWRPAQATVRAWQAERDRLRALEAEPAADPARIARLAQAVADGKPAAEAAATRMRAHRDAADKDRELLALALILGLDPKPGRAPAASAYLKRYQDDYANPTSNGTRSINRSLPHYELATAGGPIGGAAQAAIAYIFADADAWPGWQNGWHPGNPNFHTDKYMAVAMVGALLPDHPDADEWLAFARNQLAQDVAKTILPPDGVGWECPGYSGYSLGLQLEIGRLLARCGLDDPFANHPHLAGNLRWHRKLLTPRDSRFGHRHEAPIGDTHRWNAGGIGHFRHLAAYLRSSRPQLAAELVGTWELLRASGAAMRQGGLHDLLFASDPDLEPTAAAAMDWSSEAFAGFGALLRDGFGDVDESFVSLKAGRARGHYHNDDLSFHAYLGGVPVALDYNCSYHPRGDHAALHNSGTFGHEGTVRHNGRDLEVAAAEQLGASARLGAFVSHPWADAVVAERAGSSLVLSPVDPHDAEFARGYPRRATDLLVHRRLLVLVKRPPGDALGDYLVVHDETAGGEPFQLNLHLLGHEPTVATDGTIMVPGQLGGRFLVATAAARAPEIRSWHYLADSYLAPPEAALRQAGEDHPAWSARLAATGPWPPEGWRPEPGKRDREAAAAWDAKVAESAGRHLQVPPGWTGLWPYGEYQAWLRWRRPAATPTTWVLLAPRAGHQPSITVDDGTVTVDGDNVQLATGIGIVLTRSGQRVELLPPLAALGRIADGSAAIDD